MKLNKKRLNKIINEELYKVLREQDSVVDYHPSLVIKLVVNDDFLEQQFESEEGSVSERLLFIFDEYIKSDPGLQRDYEKVCENLIEELKEFRESES